MANGHGGRRPGAGRRKGVPNLKTKPKLERLVKAASEGITPLEVMLEAMRKSHGEGDLDKAVAHAKEAAPYMHPRLGQNHTTVAGDEDAPLQYQVLTAIDRDSMIIKQLAPPEADDTEASYH